LTKSSLAAIKKKKEREQAKKQACEQFFLKLKDIFVFVLFCFVFPTKKN